VIRKLYVSDDPGAKPDLVPYQWAHIDAVVVDFHEKRSHIVALDKTCFMVGPRDNEQVEMLRLMLPLCVQRGLIEFVSEYDRWALEVL
jgi:hypothetical protein